jgi:hypothetical protein
VSSGRGYLRFRLQESGVFQPLWWLDGSRVRAVGTWNGGTALEATFSPPGLCLDRWAGPDREPRAANRFRKLARLA